MKKHEYWVYIMMNHNNRVIYIGVTNDLSRRVTEHREGRGSEFTGKFHVTKLVYAENFQYVDQAIQREHQMKAWKREWKLNLISKQNPHFEDVMTWYI